MLPQRKAREWCAHFDTRIAYRPERIEELESALREIALEVQVIAAAKSSPESVRSVGLEHGRTSL